MPDQDPDPYTTPSAVRRAKPGGGPRAADQGTMAAVGRWLTEHFPGAAAMRERGMPFEAIAGAAIFDQAPLLGTVVGGVGGGALGMTTGPGTAVIGAATGSGAGRGIGQAVKDLVQPIFTGEPRWGAADIVRRANADIIPTAQSTAMWDMGLQAGVPVALKVAGAIPRAAGRIGELATAPSSAAQRRMQTLADRQAEMTNARNAYERDAATTRATDAEKARAHREQYDAKKAVYDTKQQMAEDAARQEFERRIGAAADRETAGAGAGTYDRQKYEAQVRAIEEENRAKLATAQDRYAADKAAHEAQQAADETAARQAYDARRAAYEAQQRTRTGQQRADEANQAADADYAQQRYDAQIGATTAADEGRLATARQKYDADKAVYEAKQAADLASARRDYDARRAAHEAKQDELATTARDAFLARSNEAAETQARIAAMMPDNIVTDMAGAPRSVAPAAPPPDTGLGRLMPPPPGAGRSTVVEPPPLNTVQFQLPSQAMRDVQQQGDIVSALSRAGLKPPPGSVPTPSSLPSGGGGSLEGFVPPPRVPFEPFVPPETVPFRDFVPPASSVTPAFVPKPGRASFAPDAGPFPEFAPPSRVPYRDFVPPTPRVIPEYVPRPAVALRVTGTDAGPGVFMPPPRVPYPAYVPPPETVIPDFVPKVYPDLPPVFGPRTKLEEYGLKGTALLGGGALLREIVKAFGGGER